MTEMIKVLILFTLVSCVYVARPADIVKPGPIMCQPLSEDVWNCRDANGWVWHCDAISGMWSCSREP